MGGGWRKVAKRGEVKPGEAHLFEFGGGRFALFDIGGTIYCIEDVCTHDDGPVAEGPVHDNVIECPRHGARFDIRTGAVLSMPAVVPVRTFPVKVEGGDVLVGFE
jgi:3-phenylpropionate/trans-cinnamate dioxygenase ferredoxin subunit